MYYGWPALEQICVIIQLCQKFKGNEKSRTSQLSRVSQMDREVCACLHVICRHTNQMHNYPLPVISPQNLNTDPALTQLSFYELERACNVRSDMSCSGETRSLPRKAVCLFEFKCLRARSRTLWRRGTHPAQDCSACRKPSAIV